MALFGASAADNFQFVKEARAFVVVSAQHLCYRPIIGPTAQQMRTRMECDVWEGMAAVYAEELQGGDRVGTRLQRFVNETEQLCRPIIDRSYAVQKKKQWLSKKPK